MPAAGRPKLADLLTCLTEFIALSICATRRLAEGCRKAVEGWGLQTLCRDPRWKSDSLTVIEVPQGIDSQKVVDVAYAK